MKSLAFVAAGALPLALGNTFAPASSSSDPKGVLRFPLKASLRIPSENNDTVSKRQTQVPAENQLTGTLYTVDVSIGTPGQTVSLRVDTGSAETWINPICSSSYNPQLCTESGRLTASSSLTDLYTDGTVQYYDGYVNFRYYYDFFSIGCRLQPLPLSSLNTSNDLPTCRSRSR